jgi:hypothetical protein
VHLGAGRSCPELDLPIGITSSSQRSAGNLPALLVVESTKGERLSVDVPGVFNVESNASYLDPGQALVLSLVLNQPRSGVKKRE